MKMHNLSRRLLQVLPAIVSLVAVSQPVHAQYYNPNQALGSIQSSLASGLLTNWQAQELINRHNNLAKRAAKLLANDGGVLTPNDRSKLAQEALKDAQLYNDYVSSNNGGLLSSGLGTGGGISGFLGNLLGIAPANNLASPYGTGCCQFEQSGGGLYGSSMYNNPFLSAYNSYTNAGLYSMNNPYLTNNQYPYGGNSWSPAFRQQMMQHRAMEHARWEAMHGRGL